jgi:hypothetical protein
LVNVGFDDPWDAEVKTDYLDEVSGFTNLADLLVVGPRNNVVPKTRAMNAVGIKPLIHLSALFFVEDGANAPSGHAYRLRADYVARWSQFRAVNAAVLNPSNVQVLYLGEEPTWNGISFADLKAAADLIKASTTIPVLVVEGYPTVDALRVPPSVDWVGFDHYWVKDPQHDAAYQREWNVIKGKLTRPDQKLVVILDAWYYPAVHGFFGIQEIDMASIARSYYAMAQAEPKVVALIGYAWPGGFDDPSALGARELNLLAQLTYLVIGHCITGK